MTTLRRFLGAAALALALPLALRACGEPLRVASPSMEPTLRMGDHVLVVKRPRAPLRRGEVVAFRAPPSWTLPEPNRRADAGADGRDALRVKRVAALEGDTVRLARDSVWVNGRLLPPRPNMPERVLLRAAPPLSTAPDAAPLDAVPPGSLSLDAVRRCDVVSASRKEGGDVVAVADRAARACLAPFSPVPVEAPRPNLSTLPDTSFVVAVGTFLALGDYPAASLDSRRLGVVPVSGVVGRVARVLVSYNETTRQRRPGRTFCRVE